MIRLGDIIDEARVFRELSEPDINLINKAYVYSAKVHAGQKRCSGEPYLSHPLEVSLILARLGLDTSTIATGLLHDTVEDTLATQRDIEEMFGAEISRLVDGTTQVTHLSNSSRREKQAENFRKLILATAKDMRVVLIKLADRLHNMRTLEFLPYERRRRIAEETMDIYAPLAHRLGIGWLASELEDLSFRFLNPREYARIEQKMKKGKRGRERRMKQTMKSLEKHLATAGIECEVSGRLKSFYSIYRKMKWQNLEFAELHDIIALRVVAESVRNCYLVLGESHALWSPVPGKIKDYISLPKSNGYQSLHTTIILPDGDQMEIQIRTRSMHEFAEKGVAAHWNYKGSDADIGNRLSRIGDPGEITDSFRAADFMESLKAELEPSVIYVYTPKAELIELPVGSTVLDFAYRIHTDVGNRCGGAVINREPASPFKHLKTGDIVEVKVSEDAQPAERWLSAVVTPEAKRRIKKELAGMKRERSLDIGRNICERRLAANGRDLSAMIASGELVKPLKKLGYSTPEDFFRMVGFGGASVTSLQEVLDPSFEIEPEKMGRIEKILERVADPESRKMILVENETVMTRFSNCCLPVPGEDIVGHVTRGSGVVVHSSVCEMGGRDMDGETAVRVEWRDDFKGGADTGLLVVCADSDAVAAQVKETISSLGADKVEEKFQRLDKGRKYGFLIKVKDIRQLETIIDSLSLIEGIVSVSRSGRELV